MSALRCVANPQALVARAGLGRSASGALVDRRQNPRLFRYDPASGENRELAMPERIGCVALRRTAA
jgi:hypothetical protein